MRLGRRAGSLGRERPFLTAQWRDLVLLNYEVPEALLMPFLPAGTHLDHYDVAPGSQRAASLGVLRGRVGRRGVCGPADWVGARFRRTSSQIVGKTNRTCSANALTSAAGRSLSSFTAMPTVGNGGRPRSGGTISKSQGTAVWVSTAIA